VKISSNKFKQYIEYSIILLPVATGTITQKIFIFQRNITVYAELAFSRVVDSCRRCPQALRELFAELRSVVEHFFPGREDVARLALSSFLIMRFFAAAILNPKLFALKLETPDVDVSRTLVSTL